MSVLRVRSRLLGVAAVLSLVVGTCLTTTSATADTAPPASENVPATVSIDPLAAPQINGVAWSATTVNGIVYVAGRFTSARPSGSPLGTNETPRANLLAFNINTGVLTSFSHTLNQQAVFVSATPDGSRIYVGGNFTTVDGKQHVGIAAFDTSTGNLISTFNAQTNGAVRAITATNTNVYVGGAFTKANGVARTNLAEFSSTGVLQPWNPVVTGATTGITALLLTPDQSKVVIAGRFTYLNGTTVYGFGAVDTTAGANVPWASQNSSFPIRDANSTSAITSITTDGTQLYISGYQWSGGTFEGTAAINPNDGSIIWVSDCHGDTYFVYPMDGVVYSVSHAHDCQPAGAWPQTSPRTYHRALAETTYAAGVTGPATNGYTSYQGWARPQQLDWYPTLDVGNSTGSGYYQAAWSITGNGNYLVLAGEMLAANGTAVQGLVRYAIPSLAPNKIGPKNYSTYPITATTPDANGNSTLTWPATFDNDNEALTYRLYRDGGTTPIYTTTVDSTFWNLPTITYTDTGLVPGSTHTYKLTVKDPWGNGTVANP